MPVVSRETLCLKDLYTEESSARCVELLVTVNCMDSLTAQQCGSVNVLTADLSAEELKDF